jgi:ABC-type phosphate transport system substrate-binding protein
MPAPAPARLLLVALLCLAAAACGGSGDEPSTAEPATTTATTAGATTAPASQACADAAALKASVAELDQLDPPDAGKAGIQAALEKVRTNLATLRSSAASQWGTEVGELDSAVNGLQTTVSGIDGNSLLSSLPTIVSDLERIDGAWTALERRIDEDCGP